MKLIPLLSPSPPLIETLSLHLRGVYSNIHHSSRPTTHSWNPRRLGSTRFVQTRAFLPPPFTISPSSLPVLAFRQQLPIPPLRNLPSSKSTRYQRHPSTHQPPHQPYLPSHLSGNHPLLAAQDQDFTPLLPSSPRPNGHGAAGEDPGYRSVQRERVDGS